MFIENKYFKWYYAIINNAKDRINENVYTEKHHIIPKSLGGTDDVSNLVSLTAKEHFICHMLLVRMTEGDTKRKMSYAAWQMTWANGRERYVPTSRVYELLKKQMSENMIGVMYSERYGEERASEIKKRIGEKSKGRKPMLGKKHSSETKEKISKAHKGKKRKPFTKETKNKMSKTWKEISPDRSGDKNPMYGKTQSLNTKKLISEANSGKNNGMYGRYKDAPIITCPHCGKSGKDGPNFKIWHFDKCKKK